MLKGRGQLKKNLYIMSKLTSNKKTPQISLSNNIHVRISVNVYCFPDQFQTDLFLHCVPGYSPLCVF